MEFCGYIYFQGTYPVYRGYFLSHSDQHYCHEQKRYSREGWDVLKTSDRHTTFGFYCCCQDQLHQLDIQVNNNHTHCIVLNEERG